MADRFRRSRRGGAKRTPPRTRRRRSEPEYDDEWEDAWEDEDDFEEPEERPRRRRRTAPRGRRRSAGQGRRERAAFDWSVADSDDGYERDDDYDDYEDDRRPRRRGRGRGHERGRPSRGRRREKRKRLMDLCTPVFGYAALLPRATDASSANGAAPGGEPAYDTFRQQVVSAIRKIVDEAADHGIERQDAEEASYALALFIDEAVAGSGWSAKGRWSGEPLHISMHGDPEGGIHFYERMERLGDRQREVRAVYLVCLALGFRGKYIEMEATQQVARIGEVKEKALRQINKVPIERRDMLFPEAYREAAPIEDDVPAAPRWWLIASLSVLAGSLILYLVLFVAAGRQPRGALETLEAGLPAGSGSPAHQTPPASPSASVGSEEERP